MKDFVYNEYIERTDQNIQLYSEIQQHRSKLDQLNSEMHGPGKPGFAFSTDPQQIKYLSKNERMIYQEKLHKMELMLKGFKELFEKEKQINIQLTQKYQELQKYHFHVNDNNELLIRSNQLKQEKNEKLLAELEYYKKQCSKLMEMLKNRKAFNMSVTLQQEQKYFKDIAVGIFSPRFSQIDPEKKSFQPHKKHVLQSLDLDHFQKPNEEASLAMSHRKPNESESKDQKPIIKKKPNLKELVIEEPEDTLANERNYCLTTRENNDERRKPIQSTIAQYYDMSSEECKEFLKNMTTEFNKNFEIQISNLKKKLLLNTIKQCESIGEKEVTKSIRRSNSDPFGYFSKEVEKQSVTFKKPAKISALAISKNEIHLILQELQDKKKLNFARNPKKDPFSIDISQIEDKKTEFLQMPQSARNKTKNIMINADMSFVTNSQNDEEDDDIQIET